MIGISFQSDFTQEQTIIVESWIGSLLKKYSTTDDISFLIQGNSIVLTHNTNNLRVDRLMRYINANLQFMSQNVAETKCPKMDNTWVEKFVHAQLPLPESLQKKYDLQVIKNDLIRENTKRMARQKKSKFLVLKSLSIAPFDENLLQIFSRIEGEFTLSAEELLYMDSILNSLTPVQETEKFAIKPQLIRIESLIVRQGERRNDMMLMIKNQLRNGRPLNDDQREVLESWEFMYSMTS
jgi:uncharacterized protein (UPF0212 family)